VALGVLTVRTTPSSTGDDMTKATPAKRSHGHEHTNRCYWDYLECRWVCRPAADVVSEQPQLGAMAAPSS
jgi:hypothetical protein